MQLNPQTMANMNGAKPSVADMAQMSTEERMLGMEHSEVRYFTRSVLRRDMKDTD